jgi:hypothetical protein
MDSLFLSQTVPDLPPLPVLHRVAPTRWWSQGSWPDRQWLGGMNWTFVFSGEGFTEESVVMFGTRVVPVECIIRNAA